MLQLYRDAHVVRERANSIGVMSMHTSEVRLARFRQIKSFWAHSGDPAEPHVILSSGDLSEAALTSGGLSPEVVAAAPEGGDHSDFFHNWKNTLTVDPRFAEQCVDDLGELIRTHLTSFGYQFPTAIVGPQTGATYIAERLAKVFGCRSASPRKDLSTGARTFIFEEETGLLQEGDIVLHVEDTVTTLGSVADVEMSATKLVSDISFLPFAACIMNRSGKTHAHGKFLLALETQPAQKWSKFGCPLCKAGSKAVKPKDIWSTHFAKST